MRAAVIVLGDLGRSPRMQYQGLALASQGAEVDLVGYTGAPLSPAVGAQSAITIHRIPSPKGDRWRPARGTSRLTRALWDRALVMLRLLPTLLWRVPSPDLLLVQNPPALPTLVVAVMVARLRGARLVIDWHNLSHTVLALRLGTSHWLVRLTRWCERRMGGAADHHLAVSGAMRRQLVDRYGLRGVTVQYDRPAEPFTPVSDQVRAEEKVRLLDLEAAATGGRVGLLVTATSWTLDEDVELLLDALDLCEASLAPGDGSGLATLRVIISGDGPLRAAFDARLAARPSGRIRIETRWFEPAEYPTLLAAADLGVCLHRSSSGLDLPMKLADMLGCGLPVCTLDYGPVLRERLCDGQQGRYFASAAALAAQIRELFERFPDGDALTALRTRTRGSDRTSWQQGWNREAGPILRSIG